jgi:hypothetical protein
MCVISFFIGGCAIVSYSYCKCETPQGAKMRVPRRLVWLLAGIMPASAGAVPGPLATADQKTLDLQAAGIFGSATLQSQIAAVIQAFDADPYAATPEGQRTLPGAAREIVFAAVQDSINRDPSHPRLQWVWAPAHSWFGTALPAAKVLMPNVDNVFRIVPISSDADYRITASPAGTAPVQFSVQLLPSLPGEAQWSNVIQQVVDDDIAKAPDGSFTLTVGPQAGGTNHITATKAAHFLLIRDTIQDWQHETPYRLTVTRLDGPAPAGLPDDTTLQREAAARVQEILPRIRQAKGGGFANAPGFFQGPPNQLSTPRVREGGRWGLSSSGHFSIDDETSVVITLDPMGAGYLAVQLASGWLSSLDYLHHTATLNLAQAMRNADGSLTFVIAARDPGVANWLDSCGLHQGSIFVRWQKLPPHLPADAVGVRSVRVVNIRDLDPSLARITPQSRQQQTAQRAIFYARRYADR